MRWHLSKRVKPVIICNFEGLIKKRRRCHYKQSQEIEAEKSAHLNRAKKRRRQL